jgi:glucose/arabinose dehydrogenase
VALLALTVAGALLLAGCGGGRDVGPSGPRLVPAGAGLRAPAGIAASVYARGLAKMSAFAFDRAGRLWVATADYSGHGKDGVYLVPRAGARPAKVVAGLESPLGLAWYRDELYVASLGRVDAFSGLAGQHFSRRRTVLRGPVAGGENNNLVLASDGRMVMGVSASCDHCTPGSPYSGAVVSFRPDGSGLRVYAGGIRAPVGLAYYPGTADLFVSMNQRDDLGVRTPGDWLALVRQGEHWGFPACHGQGGTACAGVPRPVAVLERHAAVGGVAIVTGQLGGTVGTSALVAEWQLGAVWQVALSRSGSGYTGSPRRLVTGLKDPLPLVVAPDGSVLVGDWGTGRIYRLQVPGHSQARASRAWDQVSVVRHPTNTRR